MNHDFIRESGGIQERLQQLRLSRIGIRSRSCFRLFLLRFQFGQFRLLLLFLNRLVDGFGS